MTTHTTNFLATKQAYDEAVKQEPTKHWFTRHFLKPALRQAEEYTEQVNMIRQLSLRRPRTAPPTQRSTALFSGQTVKDETISSPPMLPLQLQHLPTDQKTKPSRLDPDVLLDVDAWLATSKPSSPLMGGLSYWREGDPAGMEDAANVQYAIPIIQEPDCERLATSHSEQLKSFCRRAKKQVRMATLGQVKSPSAVEEPNSASCESSLLLAVPYEETQAGEAPFFCTHIAATRLGTRPSSAAGSPPMESFNNRLFVPYADIPPLRRDSSGSAQLRELECDMEHLKQGQGPLTDSTLRPGSLTVARLPREDSMGSFSSAPTYFSGMPPPPYKSRPASSRPASILTTSSFGCIDGMNPEQRQLSRRRAAEKQRSMKGRLRRLAKKAHIRQ